MVVTWTGAGGLAVSPATSVAGAAGMAQALGAGRAAGRGRGGNRTGVRVDDGVRTSSRRWAWIRQRGG